MNRAQPLLDLIVVIREDQAKDVVSIEFASADGGELPGFRAGAHIDLQLGNGLRRSYSLCNDSEERQRYVIAVQRSTTSRGGSDWIHAELIPGFRLSAGPPRNDFPLVDAPMSVLIAGGIGITPMLGMAKELTRSGSRWALHYAVRTRGQAVFVDRLRELAATAGSRFELHVDDESGAPLDIAGIVHGAEAGAHLYACGPASMLDNFLSESAACPDRAHVERFTASPQFPSQAEDSFEVHLAKSDRRFTIAPNRSILQTLREDATGLDVNWSCGEGICGTCELRVLSGVPLHRDSVLSPEEKQAGRTMMICVSRSAGGPLVLDL